MTRLFIALSCIAVLSTGTAMHADGTERTDMEKSVQTLRPCPSSPNCVSTQSGDPRQRMEPIPFSGGGEAAQSRLRKVLLAMPRAEITHEEPGYLAASFRSRIFGFVDEAEFVFDDSNGIIHFRSGACAGYYDFGVNRSRMELIAEAFRGAE